MTLARKLIAPQLIVLALIGAAAAYQAWLGYVERRALAQTHGELQRVSAELNHLSQLVSDAEREVLSHYLDPRSGGAPLDRTRAEILSVVERISKERWPPRGAALVEDLHGSAVEVGEAQRRFFQARDQTTAREAFVRWWFVAQRVNAMVADLAAYNTHRLDEAMAGMAARQETLDNTHLFLTLTAAISAVLFAVFVIRSVLRPVAALTAATTRIGERGGTRRRLPAVDGKDGAGGDEALTATVPRLRGRDDELGSLATSIADMTDRLTRSNVQLEDALRTRDHFISIAAHELKTPITSMKLQLELLQRRLTPAHGSVPVETSTSALRRQVERLARLVEELLDVSRIQLGRLELNLEPADLAKEIASVAEQCELVLRQADCRLRLTLEHGLEAQVDRSRFEQVLVNLFANAAKYAPGSPVEVSLVREEQRAVIRFRDGGPGVADEVRPRLFQRFGRPAGAQATGLGLGLFISREVIRGLGGELELSPPAAEGAEFVIRLPLREEVRGETGAGDAGDDAEVPPPDRAGALAVERQRREG